MSHSDSISVQDLLRRARTKTRQRTYRNRHSRVSAAVPHTPGQHLQYARPIEQNNGNLTSPASPTAKGNYNGQHSFPSFDDPPITESVSRQSTRSPRGNRTYSKKKTFHTQRLLDEKPLRRLPRAKADRGTNRPQRRKAQQPPQNKNDILVEVEVKEVRKRRNPRRASVEGLAIVKRIERPQPSQILPRVCPLDHPMDVALQRMPGGITMFL